MRPEAGARRGAGLLAVAFALALSLPGSLLAAPGERPTIFTQVHSGLVQTIGAAADFQIQLPGDPAVWRRVPASESPNVTFLGGEVIPSPGRIPETKAIYLFAYRVTGPGPVTVTLVARPAAPIPPGDRFELQLQAQ